MCNATGCLWLAKELSVPLLKLTPGLYTLQTLGAAFIAAFSIFH